ncbi:HEAT repeat domain-containing protein, partial [Candidatus Omnitrophota bacterium]
MSKHKTLLKIVSLLVAVIFLHQQIVWAAGDMAELSKAISGQRNTTLVDTHSNIRIPEELAETDDIYINGGKDIVVNIQDCHSSLSAQYSIVNILKDLLKNYDLSVVAIEGGAGYIDTSILKTHPDKDIKEKTADHFMKEGKISAGEFFVATTEDDVALYGVENNILYQENLKIFREIYSNNRDNIAVLKVALSSLKDKESKLYSTELNKMVYKSRLHRESKISFDVYWNFLENICEEKGVDTKDYWNIKSFTDSVNLEKEINFSGATEERKTLIDRLMKNAGEEDMEEMVVKSLAFQKSEIEQAEYHKWLLDFAVKKGIDIEEFVELRKFTDYANSYRNLNVIKLQNELDEIEKEVLAEMFSTAKERKLYKLVRTVELLKSLFEIKLTGEDVAHLSRNIEDVTPKDYKRFIETDENEVDHNGLSDILTEARQALKFYDLAERRNHAMLANTVAAMRREGKHVAALVSGGHHSKGLTEIMKDRGLSYLVLMPKFFNDEARPYVAILTKKTGPYRELVTSGEYDLALEAYFDTGSLDELEELLAYAVGQSALESKDVAAELAEWVEDYSEAYEELPEVRREAMENAPIKPADLRKRLKSIKVVDKNYDHCEIQIRGNKYRVTSEKVELVSVRGKDTASGIEIRRNMAMALNVLRLIFDEFKVKPRQFPDRKIIEFVMGTVDTEGVYAKVVEGLRSKIGAGLDSVLGGIALVWAANSVRNVEGRIEALIEQLRVKGTRDQAKNALIEEGKEAVPALVAMLGDEKAVNRRAAVEALGEIKDKDTIGPLAELLEEETNKQTIKAIISAFVKIGDTAASPALLEAFKENRGTHKEIIEAWGQIGGFYAAEVLIRMVKLREIESVKVSSADVTRAIAALGNIAFEAHKQESPRQQRLYGKIQYLLSNILSTGSPRVREAAAKALVFIGTDQAFKILFSEIRDKGPGARAAQKALDPIQKKKTRKIGKTGGALKGFLILIGTGFITLLANAPAFGMSAGIRPDSPYSMPLAWATRYAVLGIAGGVLLVISFAALVVKTHSPEKWARRSLKSQYYWQVSWQETVKPRFKQLFSVIRHPSLIKEWGKRKVRNFCIMMTFAAQPSIRTYFLNVISRMGADKDIVALLISRLKDRDDTVVMTAVKNLGELGVLMEPESVLRDDIINALMEATQDENTSVRITAFSEVHKLIKEKPNWMTIEIMRDTVVKTVTDSSPEVRKAGRAMLRNLGYEKDASLVHALNAALENGDAGIREDAALFLYTVESNEQSLGPLAKRLSDPNASVRRAAASALSKVMPKVKGALTQTIIRRKLFEALNDKDKVFCSTVIGILGNHGVTLGDEKKDVATKEDITVVLVRCLYRPEPMIVKAATEAIKKLAPGNEKAFELLTLAHSSESLRVRNAVDKILESINEREAEGKDEETDQDEGPQEEGGNWLGRLIVVLLVATLSSAAAFGMNAGVRPDNLTPATLAFGAGLMVLGILAGIAITGFVAGYVLKSYYPKKWARISAKVSEWWRRRQVGAYNFLRHATQASIRAKAIDKLVSVDKSEETIKTLVHYTKDPAEEVAKTAATKLSLLAISFPEKHRMRVVITNALIAATEDKRPSIRLIALKALYGLAQRKSSWVAPEVMMEIAIGTVNDPVSDIRSEGRSILHEIGFQKEAKLVQALNQALESGSVEISRDAAVFLCDVEDSEHSIGPLLERLSDEAVPVRIDAARALTTVVPKIEGALTQTGIKEKLFAALLDDDKTVRTTVIGILGDTGSPEAIPALVKCLFHADKDTVKAAVEALGKTGLGNQETATLQVLPLITLDPRGWPDTTVQVASSEVIEKIGKIIKESDIEIGGKPLRDVAISSLLYNLSSFKSAVRESARLALFALGATSEELIPGYIDVFEVGSSAERIIAAQFLGSLGSNLDEFSEKKKEVISVLIRLFYDDDPKVVKAAAEAVGKLGFGDKKIFLSLMFALSDEKSSVRCATAAALAGMAPAIKRSELHIDLMLLKDKAIKHLLTCLSAGDKKFHADVRSALFKLEAPLDRLVLGYSAALASGSEYAREYAAGILGNLGESLDKHSRARLQLIDALMNALSDNSKQVQENARRSLYKLGVTDKQFAVGYANVLRDPNLSARPLAFDFLGEFINTTSGKPSIARHRVISALIDALQSKDEYTRNTAIQILERVDEPRVRFHLAMSKGTSVEVSTEKEVEDLFRALNSDAQYRRSAINALAEKAMTLSKDVDDQRLRDRMIALFMEHLEDPDEDVRQLAAYYLGEIRATEAMPALMNSAMYDTENVRYFAIQALGNLEYASAVPALRETLKDENTNICQVTVEAMEKIDSDEARFYVRLHKGNVGEVVKRITEGGELDDVSMLIMVLDPGEEKKPFGMEVYQSAVFASGEVLAHLKSVHGPKANRMAIRLRELLVKALSCGSSFVRQFAFQTLSDLNDPHAHVKLFNGEISQFMKLDDKWIGTLFKYLDAGPEIRKSAVHILGTIACALETESERQIEITNRLITILFQDEDVDVRVAAADVLGRIAFSIGEGSIAYTIIAHLESALKNEEISMPVREGSAKALGRACFTLEPDSITRTSTLISLGEAVVDENVGIRISAIQGLGLTGDASAVSPLANIVIAKEDTKRVRRTALQALGQIGIVTGDITVLENEILPVLKNALEDDNADIRKSATRAVADISSRRLDVRGKTTPILLMALKDKFHLVREVAAKGLLNGGDKTILEKYFSDTRAIKKAARALAKASKRSDADGVVSAIESLGENDDPLALPYLEKAAEEWAKGTEAHGKAQAIITRIKKAPGYSKILKAYVIIVQSEEEAEESEASKKVTMLTTHLHMERWARLAELGKFATPAIDAILEEFQQANPFTEACVTHLSNFAEVGEDERLMKAYAYAGEMSRTAIVEFFGNHISPKGIQFLKKILLTDKYPRVRAYTAQTIEGLVMSEQVKPLTIRTDLGAGYEKALMGFSLLVLNKRDELLKLGNDAVPTLIGALHDEDSSLREFGANSLSIIHDKRAVGYLINTLTDKKKEVVVAAATALGKIDDPAAIKPLSKALEAEQDPETRKIMISILQNLVSSLRKSRLERITKWRRPIAAIVNVAAGILHRIGALLEKVPARTLNRAGDIIKLDPDRVAVDRLLDTLSDEKEDVREHVRTALFTLGTASDKIIEGNIRAMLKSPSVKARRDSTKFFRIVTSSEELPSKLRARIINAYFDGLKKETDVDTWKGLATAMTESGTPAEEWQKGYTRALYNDNEEIRLLAVEILDELNAKGAERHLAKLLDRESPESRVFQRASQFYDRLITEKHQRSLVRKGDKGLILVGGFLTALVVAVGYLLYADPGLAARTAGSIPGIWVIAALMAIAAIYVSFTGTSIGGGVLVAERATSEEDTEVREEDFDIDRLLGEFAEYYEGEFVPSEEETHELPERLNLLKEMEKDYGADGVKEILDKLGVKDPEEDILKIEEAARVVVYDLPGGEVTPTPRPIYLENGTHVYDVPLDMADDVQDALRKRIIDVVTGLFDVEDKMKDSLSEMNMAELMSVSVSLMRSIERKLNDIQAELKQDLEESDIARIKGKILWIAGKIGTDINLEDKGQGDLKYVCGRLKMEARNSIGERLVFASVERYYRIYTKEQVAKEMDEEQKRSMEDKLDRFDEFARLHRKIMSEIKGPEEISNQTLKDTRKLVTAFLNVFPAMKDKVSPELEEFSRVKPRGEQLQNYINGIHIYLIKNLFSLVRIDGRKDVIGFADIGIRPVEVGRRTHLRRHIEGELRRKIRFATGEIGHQEMVVGPIKVIGSKDISDEVSSTSLPFGLFAETISTLPKMQTVPGDKKNGIGFINRGRKAWIILKLGNHHASAFADFSLPEREGQIIVDWVEGVIGEGMADRGSMRRMDLI